MRFYFQVKKRKIHVSMSTERKESELSRSQATTRGGVLPPAQRSYLRSNMCVTRKVCTKQWHWQCAVDRRYVVEGAEGSDGDLFAFLYNPIPREAHSSAREPADRYITAPILDTNSIIIVPNRLLDFFSLFTTIF